MSMMTPLILKYVDLPKTQTSKYLESETYKNKKGRSVCYRNQFVIFNPWKSRGTE